MTSRQTPAKDLAAGRTAGVPASYTLLCLLRGLGKAAGPAWTSVDQRGPAWAMQREREGIRALPRASRNAVVDAAVDAAAIDITKVRR
jgi:hypothetical protein